MQMYLILTVFQILSIYVKLIINTVMKEPIKLL